MGVILHSRGAEARLYLSWPQWRSLLRIAKLFGWRPAGTVLDSEKGWAGGYLTNDNQLVTAEDAANLAQALEAALPDIPRFNTAEQAPARMADQGHAFGSQSPGLPERVEPSLMEQFSGLTRRRLVLDLMAFCRLGALAIR